MGNIAGDYNASTGVLTLASSGATATVGQWQAALRAVTYANGSGTPSTAGRRVSFVVNDGTVGSAAATKTVSITVPPPPPVAVLENPQPGSPQSGIGLLSGWSCSGPRIGISIDGRASLVVPYGSARADTASQCGGNANTGFGLLMNFNTLGSGAHTAQLYVNGSAAGSPVSFNVTVPAGEFIAGASKAVTVTGFPTAGQAALLYWQQAQQNFAIAAVASGDIVPPPVPAPTGAHDGSNSIAALENPQPGSFQSGIGLLSGWSCLGPQISVGIDNHAPISVPYGSNRADTASVCGAGNTGTGFGLLLNFNTLGSGLHSAQLYLNGRPAGNATRFTVTVPAGEFLTGVVKRWVVDDFPSAGEATYLLWDQSRQNFAIERLGP
jgi:hypothetical protein